ncbi:hypothetical protein PT974_09977 [Cladobotryum mycophilum]|uniref:TIL domain-containing protein n=1 Tax=Cladobotryum mycophilum TaxID=491253 RepID=A0ABR0S8J6_9HYPO
MRLSAAVVLLYCTWTSLGLALDPVKVHDGFECPENEQWYACVPTSKHTCLGQDGLAVPDFCISGCFCISPLVLDYDGVCIPPEDCPKEDGPLE